MDKFEKFSNLTPEQQEHLDKIRAGKTPAAEAMAKRRMADEEEFIRKAIEGAPDEDESGVVNDARTIKDVWPNIKKVENILPDKVRNVIEENDSYPNN